MREIALKMIKIYVEYCGQTLIFFIENMNSYDDPIELEFERRRILRGILGVKYINEENIMHRDLTKNIFPASRVQ